MSGTKCKLYGKFLRCTLPCLFSARIFHPERIRYEKGDHGACREVKGGASVPGSSKSVSTLENTLNWTQREQFRFLCICFFLVSFVDLQMHNVIIFVLITSVEIWEKEKFWDWNERMMGWWMTRVVMVTLTRWGDHRSMVSRLGSISPNRIFRLIAFCLIFFWFWRTNNDLIVVFCFFDKLCLVVHHFFCRGLPFFGRP